MLPLLSFIFAILFKTFLFSFFLAITVSIFLSLIFFFLGMNYPKTLIRERRKKIESELPFSSLHLSTLFQTKLSLPTIFRLFTRVTKGEIGRQITLIVHDTEMFGLDVNTALERAIERSPSKQFKEFLWGILSTTLSGGDVGTFLRERSRNLMEDYRRKLYETSHKLSVLLEVYITAIVLGVIFFTILTSVFSGIVGAAGNMIILQFLIIVFFLPLLSLLFLIIIKAMLPTGG